jgi:hypothetical protein
VQIRHAELQLSTGALLPVLQITSDPQVHFIALSLSRTEHLFNMETLFAMCKLRDRLISIGIQI